jgi:hypothetical protein
MSYRRSSIFRCITGSTNIKTSTAKKKVLLNQATDGRWYDLYRNGRVLHEQLEAFRAPDEPKIFSVHGHDLAAAPPQYLD